MDVHPTKNVSIGIDPYPNLPYSFQVGKTTPAKPFRFLGHGHCALCLWRGDSLRSVPQHVGTLQHGRQMPEALQRVPGAAAYGCAKKRFRRCAWNTCSHATGVIIYIYIIHIYIYIILLVIYIYIHLGNNMGSICDYLWLRGWDSTKRRIKRWHLCLATGESVHWSCSW